MKLKEARNLGIKYCEENHCSYACISHNNNEEFYLVENEDKHTVFFVNKNGSLNACRNTEYAVNFHKELRRRKNKRRNGKKSVADIANRDSINVDEEEN